MTDSEVVRVRVVANCPAGEEEEQLHQAESEHFNEREVRGMTQDEDVDWDAGLGQQPGVE